jgi:hypothetical protein
MFTASRTTTALIAASLLTCAAVAEPQPTPPAKPPAPTKAPEKEPGRVLPPATQAGRVDLRPKFEAGKVTRYSMKQISDQVMPNLADPKDPMKIRKELTIGLKMTTKSVDKETGEATIELVYESVKAKEDGPLGVVDYDSTKPAPPAPKGAKPKEPDPLDPGAALTDQYKAMVGTTMTMKMSRDGRITKLNGGDSLVPSGLPGMGGGGGDALQLDGLFGPITTSSSKGFNGTAKVGEKWTHSDGMSVGPLGGIDLVTNYELRSHDRNLAKVYFSGHAEKKSSGEQSLAGLDSADHKGQYAWDTSRGELVRFEMEQKTTLSGTLTGGKPATATTSMVLERTDKK